MVEDITERKKTELARFRYAAIVESTEDAITSVTPDGVFLTWNKGAQRIFGYTEGEMLGKSVTTLIPPELWGEEKKILGTLNSGGRIEQYETIRVTKAGARLNVSLSVSPVRDAAGNTVSFCGITRDITEKKRAAEALRESEERFRIAALAGKMFVYEWDATTDVVVRSADFAKVLGSDEPPETTGQQLLAGIHPDDRERVVTAVAALTPENSSLQIRYRMVRRDGSIIWVDRESRAHFDGHGRLLRVIGMVKDVTERKMAEDKLREYERAVEGSEEMICVLDREYRYLIANYQFLKVKNSTKEQVVGHFAHEIMNPRFFESVVKPKLDECFRGNVVRYETKYPYPGIGERDIFASYFPIEAGDGIDRAACILHDITERKRNEESLRESEQQLRLAAQTGKMYAFDWDVTTDIVVRTPERLKVLGDAEPLRVSHQRFINTIYEDDRPKFIESIARLTPENPTGEVMYRIPGPKGSLVWLRSSGRAFFDAQGKMLRVIGMVADITDLKSAEESLSGMTRKLIEAQEQERARIARELHDDVNQRLAMLSVELQQLEHNPSELLKRGPELRKQMIELSNDVQALSHDLHSSKLEYLGVVAGMKSWSKEFGERQGIETDFRSDVSTPLPRELGLILFRVLQEALQNIVKHSGAKRADVQLAEQSGEIHFVISDSGRGFDVETALRGRGLGLTSIRERVRLVNGTISIESKPMGGTTIRVRAPLDPGRDLRREAV